MIKTITFFLMACLSAMNINSAYAESNTQATITETNAEFVYKYLLGEIAGQRGELILSSQLFLDLAKKTRDPMLAERATKTAAYARQQKLALEAAALWVELAPDSQEAQQASSQMLVATGNINSALPHIKELLAAEASRATTFLYLNNLLSGQEDKKERFKTIQSLAAPYPNSAEAQVALAQAAWTAEDIETAERAITKASQLRPKWETSALIKSQILSIKSPDAAIASYQAFLKDNPEANKVRMAYAKLLVRLKRYADAKPEFIKLTDNDSNNPGTHAVVGLLSLEANELDMAEKYLQQAIRTGFSDPEKIYIYMGIIAERRQDDKKAITWYNKIQKNNQHYLEAKLAIANVLTRTQGLDAAVDMLASLTDLSQPQQVTVAQAQASMLAQADRHQEAFTILEKTINTVPNTSSLIYDYAMAAERLGKLDLMERELRKVIQLQPDFAAAYNALGYSFADRNIHLDEAKKLIETAHKLSPNDHYILDSLGWVEYRLGNYALALEYLRKAHNIQEDPEISAHLGEVLWKQGQHEEAKKVWQKALKAYPENNILVSTTKKFNS